MYDGLINHSKVSWGRLQRYKKAKVLFNSTHVSLTSEMLVAHQFSNIRFEGEF